MRHALVLVIALAACGDSIHPPPSEVVDDEWKAIEVEALRGIDVQSITGVGEQMWAGGFTEDAVFEHAMFDGERWERLAPDAIVPDLATSPSDFWAVTADGLLRSDDAVTWEVVDVGAPAVYSVQGSGPDDIWAVTGATGLPGPGLHTGGVFHFDGEAWTEHVDFLRLDNQSVWGGCGRGPGDFWLMGSYGYLAIMWHWDGVAWSEPDDELVGGDDSGFIASCDAADVWVRLELFDAGDALYRRIDDAWVRVEFPPVIIDTVDASLAGQGTAWVVGRECGDRYCEAPRTQIWYVENDHATPTLSEEHAAVELTAVWTTASGRTFTFGKDVVLEHIE